MDDINKVFADMANVVDEVNGDPKEVAVATTVLTLGRIVVTDLRRIADAHESMARDYRDMKAAYVKALDK